MTDRCRTCHQPVIRIHAKGAAYDRRGQRLALHSCTPTTSNNTTNNPKDAA